jgi:DNA-binding MarR family transcriptional regulator
MKSVKHTFRPEELHVPQLMAQLFRQVRESFAEEDWGGLRQSHFRVVNAVSGDGITVTDLAEKVGMTKQGCGQFVAHLSTTGHLSVERGAEDRRMRVVRRTRAGEQLMRQVNARIRLIESDWAGRVGERRYATFRRVLDELASD